MRCSCRLMVGMGVRALRGARLARGVGPSGIVLGHEALLYDGYGCGLAAVAALRNLNARLLQASCKRTSWLCGHRAHWYVQRPFLGPVLQHPCQAGLAGLRYRCS